MAEPLTAEDRAWLETPVDVQVAPDEQRWLDTMLEMGKEDLIKYAVYQYGLEEEAARASSRNGLLQLVLLANRNGGGGAVLKVRYKYLNELKGILPPMIAVRQGGRHLYLTRGAGNNMQVLDKRNGEWIPYSTIAPKTPMVDVANQAANTAAPKSGVSMDIVLPLLPKMNREQLQRIAVDLAIEGADSIEKYPNNKSLQEAIEARGKV